MTHAACEMEPVLGASAAHASPSVPVARDLTLDLVKGVLVVVMVVYHAMNIFTTAGPDDYAYVRFVSGSFVLTSGYIVARFYEAQFRADWRSTSHRLVVRGLKLLTLFTVLNLLINLTGMGNPNKNQHGIQQYASILSEIYLSGRFGYASFQILLPIAYLLIAAPALLMLGRLRKWFFIASFVAAIALSLVEVESINLAFAVLGVIGLSCGVIANSMETPFAMRGAFSIAGSLLACVMFMKYLNANLATYALGIIIILKLMYDLSKAIDPRSPLARASILLGQYSLTCYIAQIIFMQMLSLDLSRPRWGVGYEMIFVVFATIIFLLVLSAGLAMLCHRYGLAAKVYKLIFS